MRFLADENIGLRTVNYLRRRHHDVRSVLEEASLRGANDVVLLHLANREKRIVITLDKDFGALVFRHSKKSNGVILLRLQNERENNVIIVLDNLLRTRPKLAGRFTMVSEDKIKTREM
ncbi:MAG: DUF5615 family PIN-like protein [Candidatus Vogelbacteria bacterium]|nr:DUF5615 family PIN-like protein [Candidatus Vogelbacteria bacterium]